MLVKQHNKPSAQHAPATSIWRGQVSDVNERVRYLLGIASNRNRTKTHTYLFALECDGAGGNSPSLITAPRSPIIIKGCLAVLRKNCQK